MIALSNCDVMWPLLALGLAVCSLLSRAVQCVCTK